MIEVGTHNPTWLYNIHCTNVQEPLVLCPYTIHCRNVSCLLCPNTVWRSVSGMPRYGIHIDAIMLRHGGKVVLSIFLGDPQIQSTVYMTLSSTRYARRILGGWAHDMYGHSGGQIHICLYNISDYLNRLNAGHDTPMVPRLLSLKPIGRTVLDTCEVQSD